MVITAGEAAEHLSLDAFIAQGMDYEDVGGAAKLTRMMQDLNVTHPLPVRRVRHLLDWVKGGEYDAMIGGDYLRRGQEPPPRRRRAPPATTTPTGSRPRSRRRARRWPRSASSWATGSTASAAAATASRD